MPVCISSYNGKSVPHAIAYRGVTIKSLENIIDAFKEALKAHAQAIETDVHLSRDGVVVLSPVSFIID